MDLSVGIEEVVVVTVVAVAVVVVLVLTDTWQHVN